MPTRKSHSMPPRVPPGDELQRKRPDAAIASDAPDVPAPADEPEEASDLDEIAGPLNDDDSQWDVFLDDDELDPLPEPNDFWTQQD